MGAGPALTSANLVPSYSHLIDRSRPWWKNKRLVLLNFWILVLLITSTTNGFDGSMMNGLQSQSQWESAFNHPSGGQLGLLNAIQNIGSLCGLPFAPYMTDNLGRRFSVFFGAWVMIAATVVQTASQSVQMFIGARFMIGFGLTFATSAAPLLITEVAYPSQRAVLTSVYNSLWLFGSIIAAWVTYGTFQVPNSWAWRIPSAIQGLPSVIQVCLIWFVPESPRWLISKGRHAEALKTLAYYHASGNQEDPLVEYEFREITEAINLDREVAAKVGWLTLFQTPGNRRRLRIIIALAFFSQWSGNGLISYYLNKVFDAIGITDDNTQLLVNGGMSIWSFICGITGGLLCDKAGRRTLFLTSMSGMIVFWMLQTVLFAVDVQTNNLLAGHALIAMMFLFNTFCFVLFNFVVSLTIVFNQYVNPIALAALGWKYYLVYLFWLCFEICFLYRYLVETKNRTLEETAALFDGDDTVAAIAMSTAVSAGIVPGPPSVSEKKEVVEEQIEQVSA
ncbi:hexose transporter [Coniophora puteana RWD-64-598 SS2]|uniref:Hexose transporter n=1 Tax=Coniophora puteana (strain RWD-64-598) TaxID=741705 RepID=A0A5M3MW36_CONPW|nr:hexose transporter [Coniophora puteana RWD-64-598 SS2]EIW83369.1 hexose transporter [Coniophora puteana RWD-64-598 SS2]